ncbi:uncharacterized protein FA14DRAFT_120397 [Meira miltonrushii]|uniref:C2H2-type domain-containing protein n=1 Tax=Meira miltonrushii TaxID=1280837 RepID=A0A316VD99_9BASI|nr:uncharacterized protein FA14DRAFT_120397 [Meira miltonrushii]PWN35542.1 hypothetical protein FA14DRAFT_120397 [Meira miltonrushii]
MAEGTAMFTCLSCSIAYANPEDQRAHYRTDLHRYNMKRRVANLPPVRADVFNAKILERNGQADQTEVAQTQDRCRECNKSFSSQNAFQSHLNSKKHKETVSRLSTSAKVTVKSDGEKDSDGADSLIVRLPPAKDGLNNVSDLAAALPDSEKKDPEPLRPGAPMALQVDEDATEEEIQAAIDAKVASSKRVDPTTSCIFCNMTGFKSIEDSLKHMSSQHSFFIPEQEYLVDLVGLMKYLSDKICVGNICLFCNGKGRGFHTAEAVRKHMIDKAHCKIAYEHEEDKMELSDFFDFTSSYPDAGWEDVSDGEGGVDDAITEEGSDDDGDDDAETLPASGVRYGDNEFELVLPSGVRLGHRSMRRYYNQSLRPPGTVATSGNLDPTLVENRGGHLVKARNRGEAREAKKHISTYRDMTRREHFKTQIGFKNNSQKHFRDPLLQ